MSNADRINRKLRAMEKKIVQNISNVIEDNARLMETDVAESIASKTSGGREYKRGRTNHTASKGGDAPNTDTGRLLNSITTKMINPLTAEVGSYNTAYAYRLEFGTSKMEARPFLQPQFDKYKPQILREISGVIRTTIKGEAK